MAQELTFEQWLAAVNRILARKLCGLTTDDLPDCCYMEWYEDGMTPADAAKEAYRNAQE